MKKILLIEDDRFLVRIYETALEKEGYQVKLLENGRGAQTLIKKFKPDLVLLDLIMPVIDGFQTLTRLRHDPVTKNQPVFVITALETSEDIAKIKTLGVEKIFFKLDHDFDHIIKEIKKYLQK